ncbi:hypothetical protein HJG60_008685 [Phyllostomus discolor]|uniref:Uncharacterized protein n=1 Tax=Phyllostomus discolor TaxID=89673 RepID=A0A833YT60_9CHIR|nr:hypothetical protein HJG60_008685 [Phyllostomus discolor]
MFDFPSSAHFRLPPHCVKLILAIASYPGCVMVPPFSPPAWGSVSSGRWECPPPSVSLCGSPGPPWICVGVSGESRHLLRPWQVCAMFQSRTGAPDASLRPPALLLLLLFCLWFWGSGRGVSCSFEEEDGGLSYRFPCSRAFGCWFPLPWQGFPSPGRGQGRCFKWEEGSETPTELLTCQLPTCLSHQGRPSLTPPRLPPAPPAEACGGDLPRECPLSWPLVVPNGRSSSRGPLGIRGSCG